LEKTTIFDQTDILGIIVPGAGMLFGLIWIFGGTTYLSKALSSSIQLGNLGVLVLAALVAGQCVRMIAMLAYSLIGATPRARFGNYYEELAASDKVLFDSSLDSAYALTFEPVGRAVLYKSRYWQTLTLMSLSGRASLVSRADQQFTMVSGLAVAALIAALSAPFGIRQFVWQNILAALALTGLLGTQAYRWANTAAATLIGWFAWLVRQDNWKDHVAVGADPKTPS